MDDIFGLLQDPDNLFFIDPEFSRKEIIAEKKRQFNRLAGRVYNLSLAYLELKNVPLYIQKFNDVILPYYKDVNKLPSLRESDINDQEESKLTRAYKELLYPFRAFGGGEEKYLSRLDILENILQNTAFILQNKKKKPGKEKDVYDHVKIVCEATFPHEAQFDGGLHPFYQLAKCYKPDILVPFLNCAIEYKFAKTQAAVTSRIDEILVDVPGYSNHGIYKYFYAVFYVKSGVMQKKRFDEIWKAKGFPENWKGMMVEGPVK